MPSQPSAPSSAAPRRPLGVTLISLGVLIIAGFSLWRLVSAVRNWAFVAEFQAISPLYLALSGLLWAASGLPLAWGLWRGQPRSPGWARLFALGYALYHWFDRLLLSNRAVTLTNWPFALALTGLLLAFVFLTLARRQSQDFFARPSSPP